VPGNMTFAGVFTIMATVMDGGGSLGSATAEVAVGAGNGNYRLQLSAGGTHTQLFRGSTLIVNQPAGVVDLVIVVGAANKNDSLNVNGINGNPIPVFGVGFSGRNNGQDTLTISNATYDLTTYNYDNVEDGHIGLVQGTLTREVCYDDLESIVTSATTAHAVFNLPDDDNDAVIQRSGTSLTLTPADPPWAPVHTFTPTKFVLPSASMVINGNAGADIVEIIGANSITLPAATVMNVELTEIEMNYTTTLTIGTMSVLGGLDINELRRINGTAIQVQGNVTSRDPLLEGTAKISLIGSTNQTLAGPGQLSHLDISKTGGTVQVVSDIGVRGNLTGSGGTFVASPAYLVLQDWSSTVNFSGPVSLYNLEIYKIYTEKVTLLSDMDVQGDLRVLMGHLDLGTRRLTVGGDMFIDTDRRLSFSIDVANPPATPRLDVTGTLTFAAGSRLRIDTSGSTGPSVGGNHELAHAAGGITGFSGVLLELGAAVDAVFADPDSLFLDLEEP
jgi:hypothetical protein